MLLYRNHIIKWRSDAIKNLHYHYATSVVMVFLQNNITSQQVMHFSYNRVTPDVPKSDAMHFKRITCIIVIQFIVYYITLGA